MLEITDITTSIQIPQLIRDDFIKAGHPVLDNKNRPIHYSGGFAVVFPFLVDNQKWAFRCWSADLGNVESRLRKISETIKVLNLPYFCGFTYQANGLVVNGETYPTTRMRWIDGDNIKDYICLHRNEAHTLRKLADDFLTMCDKMHACHIAHGDLQHGNILVDKEGNIYLIDYDSMYVPALNGENNIINGIPDYQHPQRANSIYFSYKLDYFSELIIYLSILAISERPSLVEDYKIEDADRLLFSKDDYENLTKSRIYKELSSLSPTIKQLLTILKGYLKHDNISDLGSTSFLMCLNGTSFKYGQNLYCTYCGTKYSCTEENRFCINCGKELNYGK